MKRMIIICVCFIAAILGLYMYMNLDIKDKDIVYTELREMVFVKIRQNPDEYTVYIQENGLYEPYLVLDDDYDGGVLLLRKHVSDEEVQYKNIKSYGSRGGYYPKSDVDAYLNTNFFSKLMPELQDRILDTSISVSTLEAVDGGGS